MEFGIEPCALLIMKSGEKEIMVGIEPANSESHLKARRERKQQLIGNIGSRHYQTSGDKGKNKKSKKTCWKQGCAGEISSKG